MGAIHSVTQYALDAIENKIVVGRSERLACLRHLHDLARAGQLSKDLAVRVRKSTKEKIPARDKNFPWIFDEAQASFVAIEWFGHLRHVEGKIAGQKIVLIPAHVFDVGCIFGWTARKKTITRLDGRKVGLRRFTKALTTEGRKNAKTTRIAGIALYMLVGDREENPAIYTAAYDKKQARVCFNFAMRMAKKSPEIYSRLRVGKYEMSHKTRGGEMTAFSGEVKNKDSFNPSCSVVDEYWSHPTSEIYDAFDMAQGQRLQPLIFIITTAGRDVESPCFKEIEYCKDILEKSVNGDPLEMHGDRYFVMVRELDKKDKENDPKNWIKANPLLCSTAEGLKEFKDKYDEVFGSKIPEKIREFRTKKLNRWIAGGRGVPYMTEEWMEKWDKLKVSRTEFWDLIQGQLCNVGVDLAKNIDLTADAFSFILPDGRVALTAHGFIPSEAVDRHEKTDKIMYREMAENGWLTITDGDVTNYNKITEHIQKMEAGIFADQKIIDNNAELRGYTLTKGVAVHELCFDPYNATQWSVDMHELGYETVEIKQVMQNLTEATKYLRELIVSGMLVHDGSPLLRTHLVNALLITDTKENIMVSKKFAGDTKRIDLLAASITSLVQKKSLEEASNIAKHINSNEFGF